MWGVLVSALKSVFGWLISGAVIKFVIFSAIAYVVSAVVNVIAEKVDFDGIAGIGGLVSGLPAEFLYFVGVFRLDVGIPMIIAAYVVRFGIRRLPIIG